MPLYGLPGFDAGTTNFMQQNPYDLTYGKGYTVPNYVNLNQMGKLSPQTMNSVNQGISNQVMKKPGIGSMLQQNGGALISSAINFTGDAMKAFGPVKGTNELLSDSGTTNSIGNGFQYTHQNDINTQNEMNELNKENPGNTMKSAASGAALGVNVGSIVPGTRAPLRAKPGWCLIR